MQQDKELARRCRELAETSRTAGAWLRDNADTVGSEGASLQKNMRTAARFYGKCEQAALRKMCVGVFGPSQSGKSYLISALASNAHEVLQADFCGKKFSFIEEINPEGGKESTGLVTRFTTTPPAGITGEFPIRLRLLSETDVARVLANTYYADCDHKDAPDAEAVGMVLEQLEKHAASAPVSGGLSGDDMEELREYVNKNFLSRPRVQMLQNTYWHRAVALAPLLDMESRARLVGLVWDSVPEFQETYLRLCAALAELDHATEANCPIEALIPRANSIIDVARLQGLGEAPADMLQITTPQGRSALLPRAVVTALTAEITVYMSEKPDDFFDHTDLLDFPGYRARYKFTDLRAALDSRKDMLKDLFLRGKVAYLFERYREEKELTSMLLCIGPSTQEVQDLPQAVYEWICSTHGETPQMRANKPPALFFVLTKMDMEFEKKAGSPSVETRWTTRLESSLLNFFGQVYDWPQNWDGTRPFNNVFLLRNPNFLCEGIFEYEGKRETGIRAQQSDFVEEVRQSFLGSPLVQRHVAQPERAWQAAMTLNDGGVSLLRECLRPLCNPELKRRQILDAVREKSERTRAALAPFYHSDDREELRRQKTELSRELVSQLARVAEKQMFGQFLRSLQVREYDLYEICINAQQGAEQGEVPVRPALVGSLVSADDILEDVFGEAAPRTLSAPQEKAEQVRDMAGIFSGLAVDHWTERLRDVCNSVELRNSFGLSARMLDQFCHELLLSASRKKLRETLESELRRNTAYSTIARERLVWKLVSLTADAINAFVDWLGFDPRFNDQSQRTVFFHGKNVCFFAPPPEIGGEPRISEEQAAYDRAWYTDWMRALAYNMTANVDFDGQHTANPEQNERLRNILRTFEG
ncbi:MULTISPECIES: virulence factor SrfC family protein [unclassified Desulfovibrio]|uniref:virulence factor SrfC family protein n=1 Tax=unclassified Desulfovibrio TaxID=2593640 RepID=UPI000F5EF428|nr:MULTISPECIES: virulence factor SrfC family protein [unclassified Desulfovibrio]RRD71902.1 type III effector HopL1 [Desulfovibrio sp. OH1209_COT-279]RRD88115.1 type III effector HopL1 [Desulfovibrio sp. OH1186_COT-070]